MPETRVPEVRWNTTKDGHVLTSSTPDSPGTNGAVQVRHFTVCRRCGAEQALGARRHDGDQPQPEQAVEDKAAG